MPIDLRPPRSAGQTSDSPQRPGQRMHAEALTFDLAAECDLLRGEESWQRGDRNAKTLVKEPGFRVVLVALRAGAHLAEHAVHEQATVQVLTGHLTIHVAGRRLDVRAGGLVSLEPRVNHDVEALEESAVLLTIAAERRRPRSGAKRALSRQRPSPAAIQHWTDDGGALPPPAGAV